MNGIPAALRHGTTPWRQVLTNKDASFPFLANGPHLCAFQNVCRTLHPVIFSPDSTREPGSGTSRLLLYCLTSDKLAAGLHQSYLSGFYHFFYWLSMYANESISKIHISPILTFYFRCFVVSFPPLLNQKGTDRLHTTRPIVCECFVLRYSYTG